MKNRFYVEESHRIREKNYEYYIIIGIIWILNIIVMCCKYNGSPENAGRLSVSYCYIQFFGAFQLMASVSENLYYVKELGQRNLRLKKYESLPLLKKQCILAYEAIMAKYLLLLTGGFLILFFSVALVTHTELRLFDTVTGILWFLLASAIGYVWFTVTNVVKNIRS